MIMSTLWARKKNWIGHVIRHDNLLTKVIEGRMEGKRGRGRKRIDSQDRSAKRAATAAGRTGVGTGRGVPLPLWGLG